MAVLVRGYESNHRWPPGTVVEVTGDAIVYEMSGSSGCVEVWHVSAGHVAWIPLEDLTPLTPLARDLLRLAGGR